MEEARGTASGRPREPSVSKAVERVAVWRWIRLWPPAASLELLVDYVVSRKPRSSRLGGTLASRTLRKRERRGKESQRGPRAFEGKEMPNPGTQTRTQARTQRAKRDERDERVGELIRRQECRPEETPTTVYTRFQTRCWGATVDHGHARLAMASTRLRTFPFPEGKI